MSQPLSNSTRPTEESGGRVFSRIVKSCKLCPEYFHGRSVDTEVVREIHACWKAARVMLNTDDIPVWCPLPRASAPARMADVVNIMTKERS